LDLAAEHGDAFRREVELAREAREVMRRHADVFGQADAAMRLQIQQVGEFLRDNNPLVLQLQEVAQILRDHNPVTLQLQRVGQIIRDNNPLILQIQQVVEIIRNMPALLCQVEPMVQASERFARSGGWPVPPFEQRLVSVVDAVLRDVTPPGPVAHQRTASLAVTSVIAATATVTASSDPTPRSAPSAGRGTMENPLSGQAERSIGQILALVLVAIATWRLLILPEQDWAAVDHRLTVIGFGLTIAMLIWSKQNESK